MVPFTAHSLVTPPVVSCSPEFAHGAYVMIADRQIFVLGRRRAGLAAALAEADPVGVELFPLDVAALTLAGIAVRAVEFIAGQESAAESDRYVATAPLRFVNFVRFRHLFGPVADEES